MAEQPPYAPNVENQTVYYGGQTWKGNPGTGWTPEGASDSSGNNSNNDIASLAKQQMQLQQQANQPAIASLQASIPEIQSKYASTDQYLQKQVGSLDERYKNLLDSIKGNQQAEEQRTGLNTSTELGKRGITSNSGLYTQTVNNALSPVTRSYTGQIKDLGVNQQSALDTLLNQITGNTQAQTAEERAVQNAIAQLQAGGNSSAITNALQLYQTQQSQNEAQKERDLKTQLASLGGSDQNRYITLSDGATLYDTVTGKVVANNPKTFAATTAGWE